jgi:hypothetical protein
MASLTGLFDDLSSPGVWNLKRIHAIWFEGSLYATLCIQVTVSLWGRPLAPRLHIAQVELGAGQSERRTCSGRNDLRQCAIMMELGASVDGRGLAMTSEAIVGRERSFEDGDRKLGGGG